jgi:hypothetical protein
MKKKFFNYAVAAAVIAISSAALSACSDDDDNTGGNNVISAESPIKSDAEAYARVAGAYYDWGRLSSSFSFLLESTTESTISFEGPDTDPGPLVSRFETDKNNWYPTKVFNYLYVSIGAANSAIAALDSSYVHDGGELTQQALDVAKGRAKFIRGLDYLYLVQLWGEVPIIVSTDPTDSERTTRKPVDEVYAQIVTDLEEAAELLPEYDQIRYNPSKGAANAILARAYLQWAGNPLTLDEVAAVALSKTDPAPPSWNNERLQKVIEHADKVIGSNNYRLEQNYEDLWGVATENVSPEHIFTIHHDGDGQGDAQGNHQTHCPFTFGFDLYSDNHIGPADVSQLEKFDHCDLRKRFSITTQLYNADEKTGDASPDTVTNYKKYDFIFPYTSPRYAKWIHRKNATNLRLVAPDQPNGQPNNIDRVEIRLADVLLYKAEAKLRLGSGDKGLAEINQIRQRAGLDVLTAITQDALEKEYQLEQFFEQRHWINLTRWRKLVASVLTVADYEYFKDDYQSVASIVNKFGAEVKSGKTRASERYDAGDTNYPFFVKIYEHLHKKYDNVSGKFYRFPIPGGLKGEDLGIAQNPGF